MENASKALIIAGAILISILLISIGIILINSGRDVTEAGTAGMQSQKIQAFNAQFTQYQGKKRISELSNFISVINSSNASNPEHQVSLQLVAAWGKNKSLGGSAAFAKEWADLSSSETYYVKVKYCEGNAHSGGLYHTHYTGDFIIGNNKVRTSHRLYI